MKTSTKLLNILKESPHYERLKKLKVLRKYVNTFIEHHGDNSERRLKCNLTLASNTSSLLCGSFYWVNTVEGFNYWYSIYCKLNIDQNV